MSDDIFVGNAKYWHDRYAALDIELQLTKNNLESQIEQFQKKDVSLSKYIETLESQIEQLKREHNDVLRIKAEDAKRMELAWQNAFHEYEMQKRDLMAENARLSARVKELESLILELYEAPTSHRILHQLFDLVKENA